MTHLARTPEQVRETLALHRRVGATVGFVPTMGALHDGHLSLVQTAGHDNDVVVVSVFVNPLQFGPEEDFATYPRNLEADIALLERHGVDVVFSPASAEFAPRMVTVHVAGLTEHLEGASRPGHFDGVATIVAKLFHAVGAPDRAYFGEKDYQQLVVLRAMTRDLAMPVQIVACPTVREPDGLAASSRNAALTPDERAAAAALPAALRAVAGSWGGDAGYARAVLRRTLEDAPGVRLDYAEVCDPETLEPLEGVVGGPAQALIAAHVGATRLIDNIRLEP